MESIDAVEVCCELVDDRGVRSSAALAREDFSSEDPSYPQVGQRFVLAFLVRYRNGLAERKQELVIDPPLLAPSLSAAELEEEVTRIFGVPGDADAI